MSIICATLSKPTMTVVAGNIARTRAKAAGYGRSRDTARSFVVEVSPGEIAQD
jgi:hypothetical protein